MKEVPAKVTGDTLTAEEYSEGTSQENQNLVLSTGQTLSSSDLFQLAKAVAVYSQGGDFYTDSGVANTIVLNAVGSKNSPDAYFDGQRVVFAVGVTNTGATTINVDSVGAVALERLGAALASGFLVAGEIVEARYDDGAGAFEVFQKGKVTGIDDQSTTKQVTIADSLVTLENSLKIGDGTNVEALDVNFADLDNVRRINHDSAAGTVTFYRDDVSDTANIILFSSDWVSNNRSQCAILGNGNLENRNNSYGAWSDIKLKQDIKPVNSQWEDIKIIGSEMKNYRLIDMVQSDPDSHYHMGQIAQTLEKTCPGLVNESLDFETIEEPFDVDEKYLVEGKDGKPELKTRTVTKIKYTDVPLMIDGVQSVTKSVNYSIIYLKAVKGLSEAMIRIEELEAQNKSILDRLDALEA